MSKPVPKITSDTKPYWTGAASGVLRFPFCAACHAITFPPSAICRACSSDQLEWRDSAGSGTIHSVTTVHRAPLAAFRDDVPYVIALIDLDEGFRIMTNIRSEGALGAAIGDRVTILFEPRTGEVWLPQARLTGWASDRVEL